jgi:tRNA U34 5-methylaminomethyl-2-thiouridine-forming methyltransferase MnmC
MAAIVPAELAFAGDGTPFSSRYGDIYHSSQGGLEQARHVFLAGNGLPARWKDARRFVILETGFGLGVNFLATWQAWRASPAAAGGRLHYVAVEQHPFARADLEQLHRRWPELAALAAELDAQWPLPLPGLHRLDLGNVVLTLGFGDAAELLPQLTLAADAIYLDGFAPDRNPDLWSDPVIAQVRRLAAPGATFATWTTAGEVRRRLAGADFSIERRPGFGGKREMLSGRLPGGCTVSASPAKHIAVIGARHCRCLGGAGAGAPRPCGDRDRGGGRPGGGGLGQPGRRLPSAAGAERRRARPACCAPGFSSAAAATPASPACAPAGPACCTWRAMRGTRIPSAASSKRKRCRPISAASSSATRPPPWPAGRSRWAAGGSPGPAGSTRPASAMPCSRASTAASVSP